MEGLDSDQVEKVTTAPSEGVIIVHSKSEVSVIKFKLLLGVCIACPGDIINEFLKTPYFHVSFKNRDRPTQSREKKHTVT